MEKNLENLQMAYEAFQAGAELRHRRLRNKDFTYGRQWGEVVVDQDGNAVTEGELARRVGRLPMTHNLTRQLVKSVVGRWRYGQRNTPSEGDNAIDTATARLNQLDEMDSRVLEEFLISGCAIQRITCEKRPEGEGVWVDNVSPARFFVNRFTDPRGRDIELIGQLHDLSLKEVMMRWGRGDARRMAEIERIYRQSWNSPESTLIGTADEPDFYNAPAGRCRVIEVWSLEGMSVNYCHDREAGRLFMTTADESDRRRLKALNDRRRREDREPIDVTTRHSLRWVCRYYAPGGEVLASMLSPWKHSSHPFAVKMYPLTDGEVHSLVEDVIDQQRYVNRLVTIVDHVMSFSAKGVLTFPMEALPDTFTWEDVRSQWARPDGIVPYDGSYGTKPEQIVAKGDNAGASELLALEMKMMEQVTGVSSALQGRVPGAITSADALRTSVENASIALLDIFESFRSFRESRNAKIRGCW
ncbi:MAG: hypothetical protein J1E63_08220 [Muribaculaceae bacterium]|nr:hypothetical protein [Muribaculaceae bacterium]